MTLGQKEIIVANFSGVLLPHDGLYSIGEVQEDGYLQSVCTYGSVVNNQMTQKRGILLFYIIHYSKDSDQWDVVHSFEVSRKVNKNIDSICEYKFDISKSPKKNDIIAVFIGRKTGIIRDKGKSISFSPLQVAFVNENKTDKYKFKGSSNILTGKTGSNTEAIKIKVTNLVRKLSINELNDPAGSLLNVQVKIKSESINYVHLSIPALHAYCA